MVSGKLLLPALGIFVLYAHVAAAQGVDVHSDRLTLPKQSSRTPRATQQHRLAFQPLALPNIDANRLVAVGIRRIAGRHLVLYTDIAIDDEVRSLPVVFDQAYDLWRDYFKIDQLPRQPWKVTGCLMRNRKTFVDAGLLPDDLPRFLHGYALGKALWLDEQPTPYYRRHLLLHEGTHAFVNTHLGGDGPPWYNEGLAELLATHRWHDDQLTLGYFPANADEVPMLGRIRLVKKAVANGRALALEEVLNFGNTAHVRNEPYAWCWALATLLDGHPRYQRKFRSLHDTRAKDDLTERFRASIGEVSWSLLTQEWAVFTHDLEHGYDISRTTIDPTPGEPLDAAQPTATVKVSANRGWQNSGVWIEEGHTYQLRARGRYQVAKTTKPWLSEPGGVSIRYYHGRPLGVLLAAVVPENATMNTPSGFLNPHVVGLDSEIKPQHTGTLYFRVNDSVGELSDNVGTLTVVVSRD